ncbi:type II secretion system protein GspM [Pseudomonas sp. MWU13-2105]|uniref:type II secretion system protein GspM n=1 Tax=Pseudomonas sp. MWU13-2105 TaxID=2935074 RepID=UPI00200EB6DA|nr:type II secretion system protein GspM [Pseudomonas sp. MWU13-2105]
MIGSLAVPATLRQRWLGLSLRDRRMLIGLAIFLTVVSLFSGVWQPAQQRLEKAGRLYQQRLLLATEVQRAQPTSQRSISAQPLSTRLSETVTVAGLELQQLDQAGQSLRVTLSGNALALLQWLDQTEQSGAVLQSLSLEKRDQLLLAQVAWRAD